MGIDAYFETEKGTQTDHLPDPDGLLERLLPSYDNEHSICLRFIDPYGDTTFNQLQIPILKKELELAIENSNEDLVKNHGEKLLSLIEKSENIVHTYIKFYGD
jgi:hypothetical protein